MAVSTGILYFNFAWFREQLCIVICPYGRFQSALIDDHSLVIGYDTTRGEPRRGSPMVAPVATAAAAIPTGDCVDCSRCVQVCPTGIDIRQGLQMECIGCTACIDACDEVMDRIHKPRGLIRYDSQNAFAGGRTRWLRPRIALYGVLLGAGIVAATWALTGVRPANLGVTRIPGAPYISDATSVRNQFLVRIVNKHAAPAAFTVSLEQLPAGVVQTGFETALTVAALGEEVRPLILVQDRRTYRGAFPFTVVLREAGDGYTLRREVQFLGPEPALLFPPSQSATK
jgi:cytochrome c oxidase accessory protein FixG